jgi:hypothetical protein
MDLSVFRGKTQVEFLTNATRAETVIVIHGEEQYKVFMLDADDSLDVVVHYPSGEREIVWSLLKDSV